MPEIKAIKKGQTSFVRATIDTASIDKTAKEFDVVFATENPILRNYYWADEPFYEVLNCDKKSIRAERLDAGVVPLLDTHSMYSVTNQYGRAISWSVKNGEARARIKYTTQAGKADLWNDIENGVITGISVGPRIYKYERVPNNDPKATPTYRAVDWEVMEISFAPVPIDYKSAVRAEGGGEYDIEILNNNIENRSNMEKAVEKQIRDAVRAAGYDDAYANELINRADMTLEIATTEIEAKRAATKPTPAAQPAAAAPESGDAAERAVNAERERVAGINTIAAKYDGRLERSFINSLIAKQGNGSYLTIDQARMAILEKLADTDVTVGGGAPRAKGQDQRDTIIPMVEAVMERAMPGSVERYYKLENPSEKRGLSEAAKDFRYMPMIDICRAILVKNGEKVNGLTPSEIAKRALSTTDLPDLFSTTISRFLRMNYQTFVPEWEQFSRRVPANDFRTKTGVKVSSNITFEEIAENGEFKESTLMSDEKATIQLKTYGRRIKISRQTIINDDLGVLPDWTNKIALGYAKFRSKKVWGMVTDNVLCPDGNALFSVEHGNLGTASLIKDTALSAARTGMRRQKDPQGNELFITPKFLMVPPELETSAEKLLRQIYPPDVPTVNIWSSLQPFMNVYFTDTKAWYLVADPMTAGCDGIVHAYLDGQEGLVTESYVDKDTKGVTIDAWGDFDCAMWGWQGWHKNPGAAATGD